MVDAEAADKSDDKDTATLPSAHYLNPHHAEKKPLWWRRQAGRRGTKGQRAVLRRMEERGYVLEKKQYKPGVERYSLVDLFAKHPEVAAVSEKEYWLEIGFGRGENILTNAQLHHDRCYIGADVHQPGACTVLGRMEEGIKSGQYWDGAILFSKEAKQDDVPGSTPNALRPHRPYDNVRIYCGDGIKFLNLIPSHSLSAIVLPFPDPFPKIDHKKFRVIQPDTLVSLERVLNKGGAFYLATDAIEFFEWCCEIFDSYGKERGWQEVLPCPDRTEWLPAISYYEQKGFDEGRSTNIRCWRCPSATPSSRPSED
jgi:tRNA G46 methylase TrmB